MGGNESLDRREIKIYRIENEFRRRDGCLFFFFHFNLLSYYIGIFFNGNHISITKDMRFNFFAISIYPETHTRDYYYKLREQLA